MSGPIHALVIHHGPTDLPGFVLASVIAEDMHHADDTVCMSTAELMKRTRMARATVTRAVARGRDEGWLRYFPGLGRGNANRYQLRVREALSTCSERCSHRAPLVDQALEKGAHTEHLSGAKGAHSEHDSAIKVLTESNTTVTTSVGQSPSPESGPEKQLALGIIAAVSDVSDEEQKAVFAVIHHARQVKLEPKPHVVKAIVAALRAGHTLADIRRELDPPNIDWQKVGPGLVVKRLRELATHPKARPASRATPPPDIGPVKGDPSHVGGHVATLRAALANGQSQPIDETPTAHPGNGKRLDEEAQAALLATETPEEKRARHAALLATRKPPKMQFRKRA